MISSLDRDPPKGIPVWKMVVQATDMNGNGLVGYADIEVLDTRRRRRRRRRRR